MREFHIPNLLLFTIAIFLLPSAAPNITSDRAALLALRSSVTGRALLWNLTSPTPCVWPGVVCSADNSSVVELHLPGMGLSGELPLNTISNMTNLQTLSLRYNLLSGQISDDFFSSLPVLRNLYLQHNFFSGQIPNSLYSLTASLVRVNLAENNFSGPISNSFNNLTRLDSLFLQGNHFSGPLPDLSVPSLIQFNVSNNNLTGEIPKGLSRNPRNSFLGNSLCGAPLNSCDGEQPKKKLSGGAIAGIIVGSVVGVLLILLLVFCLCCRKKAGGVGKEEEVGMKLPMDSSTVSDANLINAGKKDLAFVGNRGLKFDLEDLLRASAEVLGKGTLGTAYKAVLDSGLVLAVKRLRDIDLGEKEFREKMEEIGRINHPNLVLLRGYHYNRDEKLLVYDYLPMGSLSALLHGNKGMGRTPLNWETRASIALGAAKGISYLHSQGPSVSHGSIKSSNVLLTRNYDACVSDFGLAQLAAPTATPNRAVGYRAPELTDFRKVSQKADVYSFGVLLLELVTGKAPTHSLMNDEGVDLPRWVQSFVREEWSEEVFDLELLRYQNVEDDMVQLLQLAVDCTAQHPDERPTMMVVVAKIQELWQETSQHPTDHIVDDDTF